MIEDSKASHAFIHLVSKPRWGVQQGALRREEQMVSNKKLESTYYRKAVELLVSGECQFEI